MRGWGKRPEHLESGVRHLRGLKLGSWKYEPSGSGSSNGSRWSSSLCCSHASMPIVNTEKTQTLIEVQVRRRTPWRLGSASCLTCCDPPSSSRRRAIASLVSQVGPRHRMAADAAKCASARASNKGGVAWNEVDDYNVSDPNGAMNGGAGAIFIVFSEVNRGRGSRAAVPSLRKGALASPAGRLRCRTR